MIEYFVLFWLLLQSFAHHARRVSIAYLSTLTYAASDEFHQTFITGRHGSIIDVAIDMLLITVVLILQPTNKDNNPV